MPKRLTAIWFTATGNRKQKLNYQTFQNTPVLLPIERYCLTVTNGASQFCSDLAVENNRVLWSLPRCCHLALPALKVSRNICQLAPHLLLFYCSSVAPTVHFCLAPRLLFPNNQTLGSNVRLELEHILLYFWNCCFRDDLEDKCQLLTLP